MIFRFSAESENYSLLYCIWRKRAYDRTVGEAGAEED